MDDIARVCLSPDDPMSRALEILGIIGIALVVEDRVLKNTLTDGDVRRALLHGYPLDITIGRLLADGRIHRRVTPIVATEGQGDREVLDLMRAEGVRQVPVVDGAGRPLRVATLEALTSRPVAPARAVIMAGGEGRRLRPLTERTPKPMLPIGGRPLLEHIIERLRDGGIADITISVRYLAHVIVEHFRDGSDFGVSITYTHEDEPLGTGGALSLLPAPQGPVIVINGDILTEVSFTGLLRFAREHEASAVLGARRVDFQPPYGVIDVDGVQVTALREKPTMHYLVNAGLYLLTPDMWDFIAPGTAFDLPDLIHRALEAERRVISFPVGEEWVDIGEYTAYRNAGGDALLDTPLQEAQ